MNFYGFQKVSLMDYPGEVAVNIFTFGCNLRCPYCHNPELVLEEKKPVPVSWSEIHDYLKKRKNVLGGVCITGGEPLLHARIPEVIHEIQALGLKVKIDTNGTLPESLKKIRPDYIAMDIKTSPEKYYLLGYTGSGDFVSAIRESVSTIISSGIDYEFRTTVAPEIVHPDDIGQILDFIRGAKRYALSQFHAKKTLDEDYKNRAPYPVEVLLEMKKKIELQGMECILRGL